MNPFAIKQWSAAAAVVCAAFTLVGCADDRPLEPIHKAVSLVPTSQPSGEVLTLNRSDVQPMRRPVTS